MNKKIEDEILNSYQYVNDFDVKKYPLSLYEKFKNQFSRYDKKADIESALKWKYGNSQKINYPECHKNLIRKVKKAWIKYIHIEEVFRQDLTFCWWHNELGKTAYITAVWITHLIHHDAGFPIIDQHNFRAMQILKNIGKKDKKKLKKKPSNYRDIMGLEDFIAEIRTVFPNESTMKIDQFLMMYGKKNKFCT